MTELRWIKRLYPPGLVLHENDGARYLVLQYRTKELVFPQTDVMALQNGDNWRWSEWQDVPVTEE